MHVPTRPPTHTLTQVLAHSHTPTHARARLCAHPPTACVARGHASGAPNTYMCPPKIFTCVHPKRVHEENHRGGGLWLAPTENFRARPTFRVGAQHLHTRLQPRLLGAHEYSWARDFSRVTGCMCASTCLCVHTCTYLDAHENPHVAIIAVLPAKTRGTPHLTMWLPKRLTWACTKRVHKEFGGLGCTVRYSVWSPRTLAWLPIQFTWTSTKILVGMSGHPRSASWA